jgi:hypothetical protein
LKCTSAAWKAWQKRVYIHGGRVWAVTISTEPTLTVSQPAEHIDISPFELQGRFDMLPDGRVVAIEQGEDEHEITHVNVVINWLDEFQHGIAAND